MESIQSRLYREIETPHHKSSSCHTCSAVRSEAILGVVVALDVTSTLAVLELLDISSIDHLTSHRIV